MRWSVIFSTSYAGSCLRGGREKEVFFEGGKKRQHQAQSRLQRGDGWEVGGDWEHKVPLCQNSNVSTTGDVIHLPNPTSSHGTSSIPGNGKRTQRATVFCSFAILTHFVVTRKWFFFFPRCVQMMINICFLSLCRMVTAANKSTSCSDEKRILGSQAMDAHKGQIG